MTRPALRGRQLACGLPSYLSLAAALALGAPGSAFAQSNAQQKAAAEALFEEGKQLLGQGQYESACRRFEQSEDIDRGVGTLLYLADCYERTGRLASAWAIFREAWSAAQAEGQGDRARIAEERAQRLAPSLSKLVLLVPQEDRNLGLEVLLDGRPLSAALYGVPFPVDSGTRKIVARAPGRSSWSSVVEIKPNDYRSLQIPVLSPAEQPAATAPAAAAAPVPAIGAAPIAPASGAVHPSAAAPAALAPVASAPVASAPIASAPAASSVASPAPAPTPSSTESARPAPADSAAAAPAVIDHSLAYIVGGAGVVGVGLGIFFGVRASDEDTKARPECPAGCATREAAEHNRSARQSAVVANIAYGAGLAALAAGFVLYFTTGSNAPATHAAALQLAPSWEAGGGRLSLAGQF